MLSPFSLLPSPFLSPCLHEGAPSPNHPLPPQHLGIPLHCEKEPSSDQRPLHYIDARQCYPLLYMQLGPWVFTCKVIVWCFRTWELWWVWIVDNFVFPMDLQTLSALSVLSLDSSLGSSCSVLWLDTSILLRISMALAEPLRKHPYQVLVSKHSQASAIVTGLLAPYGMDPQMRQSLDDLFFSLYSSISSCISSHPYFVLPYKKD